MQEEGVNAYRTISEFSETVYSTLLQEEGFDEWFYESLLSDSKDLFATQHGGGVSIFRKGHQQFSFSDFLENTVASMRKIEISELVGFLSRKYGMTTRRDKILYLIRNMTELYYDEITTTVFYNYDVYLEETEL